jgi:hypothetical protein
VTPASHGREREPGSFPAAREHLHRLTAPGNAAKLPHPPARLGGQVQAPVAAGPLLSTAAGCHAQHDTGTLAVWVSTVMTALLWLLLVPWSATSSWRGPSSPISARP